MKDDSKELATQISVTSLIKVTDLTKVVGSDATNRLTILNTINFEIIHGEAVAIIGASGSGKSTLLGLLAGLDNPTSGNVHVAGINISTLNEDARAALRSKLIGFVFQSFQLLPALNALENVMLPLELTGAKDVKAKATEILGRVGLEKRLTHYPKQLSGGEQQRVALARAFVTKPNILLADEPTGNLDPRTGGEVIDLLFELNREQATTLILVTHDDTLAARCGRRIRLSGGEMVDAEVAQTL